MNEASINKQGVNNMILNFILGGLIILTIFHSGLWVMIVAPVAFYYGARYRSENKIKGLKIVVETEKVVGE